MIHHEVSAALARERVSTYLAEADASRRARQARRGRPPAPGRNWLRVWRGIAGRDATRQPVPGRAERAIALWMKMPFIGRG